MDSACRREEGMQARARIKQHYSLDAVIGQYERLYGDLLPEGRR
jgi:hypothetical protein